MNRFCVEKMFRSGEHQQRGRKIRDMLSFRLELAKQIIGSFSTRGRSAGRPRSVEHLQLDRLNVNLGHWPKHADKKGNRVVCLAVINKKKLSLVGNRHESRIQCEHCKVSLCVSSERNCFKKYHTLVDFTS